MLFGCVIEKDKPLHVEIPAGKRLFISQACLEVLQVGVKSGWLHLRLNSPSLSKSVIVCCLSLKSPMSLLHLDLEELDGPIIFNVEGSFDAAVNLSGCWQDAFQERYPSGSQKSAKADIAELLSKNSAAFASRRLQTDKSKKYIRPRRNLPRHKLCLQKRKRSDDIVTHLISESVAGSAQLAPVRSKKWNVRPLTDEGLLVPEPRMLTKSSGITIRDYIIGTGIEPKLGTQVKLIYEGSLEDGTIFDSCLSRKKPFVFRKGVGQGARLH